MSDETALTKKMVVSAGIPCSRLNSSDPRVDGVIVPDKKKSPFSDDETQAWVSSVETLMSNGVVGISEIAKVTGLQTHIAKKFILTVEEGWAVTLTPALVNTRREKLFRELEAIKAAAWDYFNNGIHQGADVKEQGAWLKLLMEAMDRQAKMSGVNVNQVQAEISIDSRIKSGKELQSEAEQRLKLPMGQLDLIGEELAKQLSQSAREEEEE